MCAIAIAAAATSSDRRNQIVELTLKLGQAVQRNVTICFFEPRQDRLGCCPHAPWLRRRERTSKRRYLSPFDVAPIYSPLLEK